MPFNRAKSIQQIYDEVRDYDLVLVPDAPLARAINRRLDEPTFGTFAAAPRLISGRQGKTTEDRFAFLNVIHQTDYSWKSVAYAIGNILQCWEHQGHVDSVLEYDEYADATTKEVVEIMAELQTTSKQLSSYNVPENKSVAVVGLDQFTKLERAILPSEYDTFELFTSESFDHPPFHIFDSPAEIVDSLLDTITAENAENVAIVLNSSSRYSSLVESALESAEIPFYGGPGFIDNSAHRGFLQLLRTSFRGQDTTVNDVRPLVSQLGIDIDINDSEKRLSTLNDPELDWLQTFFEKIEGLTFIEALSEYESQLGQPLPKFKKELQKLGLAGEAVSNDRIDDLAFYLQTYEVPVERNNEGVLLADAQSSGYVDRPVVFYLGIDQGWTHSAPQRPWVDAKSQADRYISQFKLLLQSGTDQYYLVQDTDGGQPVTPCLYFNELLDSEFERFSDLPSAEYTRTASTDGQGFEKESFDIESDTVTHFSQSSLNNYVNCPRDYFFGELIDSPDKDYFREGNLLHDFAEFYVNYPEFVDNDVLTEITDIIVDEVRAFHVEDETPLRRRMYEIGLAIIKEFLDTNTPTNGDFLTPSSGFGKNFFAEYFDKTLDMPTTERWFENDELNIKGKIDLVHSPTTLLDYKKGRKKRETKVVRRSAIDPPADTPNFQAILYLTHYRTIQPGEQLEFTFFHILETLDDVIAGDADLADTLTTISYHPYTFDEFVEKRDAYDTLLDGYNDCVETFSDLGFAAYKDIMTELDFPATTDKEDLLNSEFATNFQTAVDAATSDNVDSQKGSSQAIKLLNGVRKKSFFKENLDAFENFIDNQLKTLNTLRDGEERFPIEGPGGEPNYRRVNHRDLILEGTSNE